VHPNETAAETTGKARQPTDIESVCSICEEGAKMITPLERNSTWLLNQVQQAGNSEQFAVFQWLDAKFQKR